MHSWFSVITETYVDSNQLLLGEKVFKPMFCSSPFMILSSAGTLARLRELGFRTFPELWDESYDEITDLGQRIAAIVQQIKLVSSITDRPAYFAQAESALRHNHDRVWSLFRDSSDWQRLLAIWRNFR
jgi:hypothetical protein